MLNCVYHIFKTKNQLYSHAWLVYDFSPLAFLIGFGTSVCDVMKTTIVCLESQGFDHRVLMHTVG